MGWEHYARLEPFGELRDDYRAASIREMIFNMAVEKKDRKPIEDFLLRYDEDAKPRRKKQSVEQQIMFLNILAATSGG